MLNYNKTIETRGTKKSMNKKKEICKMQDWFDIWGWFL